ncbi:MAG: hypothetical protein J1E63_06945 [Muribaculaceae bacterium]|nr:hypothetical protein [Muribaculaceae bacterium]
MDSKAFWNDLTEIVRDDFTPKGLLKLDEYAELFNERKLLYQRFSPREQHGCTAGGNTHVVATLLAGREVATSGITEGCFPDFKTERQFAAKQVETIKRWAKRRGVWFDDVNHALNANLGNIIASGGEAEVYDNGIYVVKTIGLDYFIHLIYALDRITLHNTYFPETMLNVIGFGEDSSGNFKIIVNQPYISGMPVTEDEIESHIIKLGFTLFSRTNWTYFTNDIYLSDLHDENVIKSSSGTIFVIDCDIRLNAPFLKTNGHRGLSTAVVIIE